MTKALSALVSRSSPKAPEDTPLARVFFPRAIELSPLLALSHSVSSVEPALKAALD